jgi:metallo-beta-lactamase family protein
MQIHRNPQRRTKNAFALTFYGGVATVTGANFLLETLGQKILVDCGLFQGDAACERKNREPFAYDPKSIKALFVTHAHADHIGRIPKLVRDGFRGVIYSTRETREISAVMFDDACRLMKQAAREEGSSPLFEEEDVEKTLSLWHSVDYYQFLEPIAGAAVKILDAGHILGSAMFQFEVGGEKLLFTGDLGNSPSPLLRDTDSPAGVNYLVMESVYGDRDHEPRERVLAEFERVVRETVNGKRLLIIPAFSLERTQVILHDLNYLIESGKVPSLPVFLDSPLAIQVTEIYRRSRVNFNERLKAELAADDIWRFPKLEFIYRAEESVKIDRAPRPKIIIAGSGMSEGGRVINHEKKYLGDDKTTILMVGFQAPGTLGSLIALGAPRISIQGEDITVRAKVEKISGYSSHKDSKGLIAFTAAAGESLRKVFVTMGEPRASLYLAQRIRDYLGIPALMPEQGKIYQL